ncbi:lantibiotic dehydratase C-terminal domain-containing protein [Actinoalloteichus spitiensis]|uniref:lantibiotic dehydratase C-terminal domain-containing protein n=1 Tax=Actinoalloteichus spitiensis TaxID=252394 RepID=UPI00037F05BE|nr:lantibiotic dehydratase C-terminal domain-containing protein [Actinoalloteichus spitiensis]
MTPTRPDGEVWRSLHVHRYGRMDAFLVDGLGPAIARLRAEGGVRGWFFLRYWRGGHHVRVRIRVRADDASDVTTALADRLSSHLTRHPSGADFDVEGFRLAQPTMAALENEPVADVLPNDTVHPARYEPEQGKYGGQDGVTLAEAFFERSSDLALAAVGDILTRPARRLGAGFTTMLRGLLAAGYSTRAMAGFFQHYCLLWSPYAFDVFLDTWPDLLAARRSAVTAHARAVLTEPTATDSEPFGLAMRTLHDAVDARADRVLPAVTLAGPSASAHDRRRVITTSCLHTHNNRIGLTPEQEAFLGFLGHHVLSECAGTEPHPNLAAAARTHRDRRLVGVHHSPTT